MNMINELNVPSNTKQYSFVTKESIQEWIACHIANLMDADPETIDLDTDFDSYGLGSVAIVSMTGELEEWLGYPSDPTLPYYYTTIAELSEYLANEYNCAVESSGMPEFAMA